MFSRFGLFRKSKRRGTNSGNYFSGFRAQRISRIGAVLRKRWFSEFIPPWKRNVSVGVFFCFLSVLSCHFVAHAFFYQILRALLSHERNHAQEFAKPGAHLFWTQTRPWRAPCTKVASVSFFLEFKQSLARQTWQWVRPRNPQLTMPARSPETGHRLPYNRWISAIWTRTPSANSPACTASG